MRSILATATIAILALALAGCLGDDTPAREPAPVAPGPQFLPALPNFKPLATSQLPTFAPPVLIDEVRAGGEPVIAITQAGTIIVSSHPGFTHYHPSDQKTQPGTELITPFQAQSYLWRSTDNGTTWQQVGLPLPGVETGPRSLGFGVSDPELTVMEDGTICYTDLEALALSSVSCSQDDGVTWLVGNSAASGGPNDRQWLASYKDELYFTANYFNDHHLRASTDRGLTWEDRGDVPCSGDIIANPANGHLYAGCGNGLAVSKDAGMTWSKPSGVPGSGDDSGTVLGGIMEPAIDSAGNIWVAWAVGERNLYAAGTPDEGKTWPWVFDLTPHVRLYAQSRNVENAAIGEALVPVTNGTYVWPWISAGSDGRFAVTWIGAYDEADSTTYEGDWYIFSAYVLDATSAAPTIVVSQLTPGPMHHGPICQSGTICQVESVAAIVTEDDSGDRRLGDFFETTIGPDGYLYGSWANTYLRPSDVISHPQFVRQTGGVRLIADDELGIFTPTQG